MSQDVLKQQAAQAALEYLKKNFLQDDIVIGVGTGSTTNLFIDELAAVKGKLNAAVASSIATESKLKSHAIPVDDLNAIRDVDVYIDGADEVNQHGQMIKGGGGALTREKIVAAASKKFICIVDESKIVGLLGKHPVAIEVVPLSRSFVSREIVKLGGDPEWRENFVTDNGNQIIDVYNLKIENAIELEKCINNIPGVVCNGIFADRPADVVIVAGADGVKTHVME